MSKKYLFTGGYTENKQGGIGCYRWDQEAETLVSTDLHKDCENPSFLAFHPKLDIIYAANEVETAAKITAHQFQRSSGELQWFNSQETTGGGMCHLTLNPNGNAIYGGNYSSGNVVAFAIHEDGSIGKLLSNIYHSGNSVHQRQETAHVHQVIVSPDGKKLIVVDFGTDALYAYSLREDGGIVEAHCTITKIPAGQGPRHLVFDQEGKKAYVLTELGNRLFVYDYHRDSGAFSYIEDLFLLQEEGEADVTGAEITFAPDSDEIYVSIRGIDRILQVGRDKTDTLVVKRGFSAFGKMPRMFSFDDNGTHLFIANQESGEVVVVDITTDQPKKCLCMMHKNTSFAALF